MDLDGIYVSTEKESRSLSGNSLRANPPYGKWPEQFPQPTSSSERDPFVETETTSETRRQKIMWTSGQILM
jgi:hypothetical protein